MKKRIGLLVMIGFISGCAVTDQFIQMDVPVPEKEYEMNFLYEPLMYFPVGDSISYSDISRVIKKVIALEDSIKKLTKDSRQNRLDTVQYRKEIKEYRKQIEILNQKAWNLFKNYWNQEIIQQKTGIDMTEYVRRIFIADSLYGEHVLRNVKFKIDETTDYVKIKPDSIPNGRRRYWRDDRAIVYIKYGAPDDPPYFIRPLERRILQGIEVESFFYGEIWHYTSVPSDQEERFYVFYSETGKHFTIEKRIREIKKMLFLKYLLQYFDIYSFNKKIKFTLYD